MFTNDLRQFIKSKEDLYCILGVEGQFHLPPFDECTMEFLRDALCGKKKLLPNCDVRSVCVPRYKEFNAGSLYQEAMNDAQLRIYLPEPSGPKCKPVNKKFLFNVSYPGSLSWSGKSLINVTNIQVFVDHQHH